MKFIYRAVEAELIPVSQAAPGDVIVVNDGQFGVIKNELDVTDNKLTLISTSNDVDTSEPFETVLPSNVEIGRVVAFDFSFRD